MSSTGISQYQVSSDFSCSADSPVSQILAAAAHHAVPAAHCCPEERLLSARLPFLPRPLVLPFSSWDPGSLDLRWLCSQLWPSSLVWRSLSQTLSGPARELQVLQWPECSSRPSGCHSPVSIVIGHVMRTWRRLVWLVTCLTVYGRNPLSRMAHLRHAFADIFRPCLAGVDHLRLASDNIVAPALYWSLVPKQQHHPSQEVPVDQCGD